MTTTAIPAVSFPQEVARQRNLSQPISEAQPGSPGRPVRAERSECAGHVVEIGGVSPVLGP